MIKIKGQEREKDRERYKKAQGDMERHQTQSDREEKRMSQVENWEQEQKERG